MSWSAKVYDQRGLVAELRLQAPSMRDAEDRATALAALMARANPAELLVRHLSQVAEQRRARA